MMESDGNIPVWPSLPYEILVSILSFAAGPSCNEWLLPNNSLRWLLSAAKVCKAFTEPALAVLYRDPPLQNLESSHLFLTIIKKPIVDKLFDYNVKVKELRLDVSRTLAYKLPSRGYFDISSLIPYIPQVKSIDIFDAKRYLSYYRAYARSTNWTYPLNFFASLDENNVSLKSWSWDARMCPWHKDKSRVQWMADIHSLGAFRGLQKLRISKFDLGILGTKGRHSLNLDDMSMCERFSDLPKLNELVCETSDVVGDEFLSFVPANLKYVTFQYCSNLDAEMLHTFLERGGKSLLEIHLTHNQRLNLSFLPSLKRACPQLQVLKVDMNFYNTRLSQPNADPLFEDLLRSDDVPTWPSTLQVIEMIHLQQWNSDSAVMLFNSLINAAKELPNLRKLTLKAILDIAWRDRANFRDEWIGKLKKVFLRVSPDPDHSLMTMRLFRQWKKSQTSESRKAGLIDEVVTDSSELIESAKTRRKLRRRHSKIAEQENERSQTKKRHFEDDNNCYIQGMCDIVDIRVDNHRPAETQFTEGDFLDSDRDDEDEDWNE